MAILPGVFLQRFATPWRISLLNPERWRAEQLGAHLADWFEVRGALNEWQEVASDPQAAVDRDHALAVEHEGEAPLVRVWSNPLALVVPRAFSNRPGFHDALRACPYPVALRRSGGTAVTHGPHVLNLSLIRTLAKDAPIDIARAFGALGAVVLPALRQFGIEARLEDVVGAHCPGRYSIAVKGRKLAGTAAFVSIARGRLALVAHANLVLQHNADDLNAITSFERRLGMSPRYREGMHTTIADEIEI